MAPTEPTLASLRIERREQPEASSRLWIWIVVVFLLGAGGGAWWWQQRPATVEVKTAMAREMSAGGSRQAVLNASGYVTARREATVSSKVTGKVMEVLVEEGMKVKEGQVLARIDDTNIKISVKLAEAQLASAKQARAEIKVRIREAEQELRRVTDLLKGNIASQAEFDHAEAAAAALQAKLQLQEAEIAVAEQQVASWHQQLDDAVIRAPFSGVVTSKNAQPGEMISPISAGGGFTRTGICTIVDMESLEVEIDVNESYINRVEIGQPVEAALDAYTEWKIPCKVIAIIPTADRQKSTVKVRVGFNQLDPRILPQMSVKVAFCNSSAPGAPTARLVMVPKAALQQQGGRDIVMVVANGRAERRAVTVSSTRNGESSLSAGLSAGERVILDFPSGMKEGTLVKEGKP